MQPQLLDLKATGSYNTDQIPQQLIELVLQLEPELLLLEEELAELVLVESYY